jgi:hypothetical protein
MVPRSNSARPNQITVGSPPSPPCHASCLPSRAVRLTALPARRTRVPSGFSPRHGVTLPARRVGAPPGCCRGAALPARRVVGLLVAPRHRTSCSPRRGIVQSGLLAVPSTMLPPPVAPCPPRYPPSSSDSMAGRL